MNKIKLLARQLDGTTLVEQAPDFQLVDGWTQATLPAGRRAAGRPVGQGARRRPVPAARQCADHGPARRAATCSSCRAGRRRSRGGSTGPRPTTPARARAPDRPAALRRRRAARDRGRAAGREHRRRQRARLAPVRLGAGDPGGRVHKATSGIVVAPAISRRGRGCFTSSTTRPTPIVVTLPPRGLVPLDATLTFTRRGDRHAGADTRRSATRSRAACRTSP
jgi:hypothetical protein